MSRSPSCGVVDAPKQLDSREPRGPSCEPDGVPAETPGRGVWIAAGATACATVAAVMAASAWLGLGPVDDAYISLRYAANWASGAGLCFNAGETVEGYTNFLLVALQATSIRCGLAPATVLRVWPLVAIGALAGMVTLFAWRYLFDGRRAYCVAAGLAVGLNPVLVCWAAAGMETGLYAALLFAAVVILLDVPRNEAAALNRRAPSVAASDTAAPRGLKPAARWRRVIASAGLLALAGLCRPEAAALWPILALAAYYRRRSVRDAVVFSAVFLIGFGTYFAARAAHFGQLFPNTFYVKLDYGNTTLLGRGLEYVWSFLRAMPLLIPLAALAVVHVRRAPVWVKTFTALVVAQLAIVAYEGGDHFAMFRFLAPVVPFMALLALHPAAAWLQRARRVASATERQPGGFDAANASADLRRANIAAVVSLGVVFLSGLTLADAPKRDEPKTATQYLRFLQEADYARQWQAVGRWLRSNAAPDASLATVAIGAVGFESGLRIIDPHGLIDPVIARQKQALGCGYAGHEKYDVDRVLARRPHYVLLVNYLTDAPVADDAVADELWGEFNQSLHADRRFTKQYRLEHVPVGGRWLNLHVRRGSSL